MKQFILYTLFFILHCSFLIAQDTSCGLVWGPIIKLSRDSVASNLPEMCAQGDTIHITWWGDHNIYKLPYALSTNGGLSFQPTRDLLQNYPEFVMAPYQKIVANKTTVFLFIAGTTGQGRSPVFVLRSFDAGANWSHPVPITIDSTGQLLYASIKGDTVLVIYRAHYNTLLWKFSLSVNGGNTWYSPQSSVMTWYADKVEVGTNSLHRLYGDTISGEVLYAQSDDLGDTWSPPTMLSTNDGYPTSEATLGLMEENNNNVHLYAAWRDPKNGCIDIGCSIPLRFSTNNGDLWSDEILLTDQPDGLPTGRGKFAIMNNIVGLAWTKTISPSNAHIQFRYSLDTGNSWSPICFPTGFSSTERSGKPMTAISPSAFHIVWNKLTYTGNFGIFYRRGALLTAVEEEEQKPIEFELEQNYPNPFNPKTSLSFVISHSSLVTVKIYNVYGQEVATLVNKRMEAGEHRIEWNAEKFPSGIYFYKLNVTDTKGNVFSQTKKMLLLK
jgi:hypothetical protein